MKIALTGHSKGIGAAVFKDLTAKNHEVFGYSRTNGWDIKNTDRVADEIAVADCFINNAHSFQYGWAQTELLRKIWLLWKDDPSKTIITIGSYSTEFTQRQDQPYAIHKHALDQTVKQLRASATYPHMVNIRPSWVDVPRVAGYNYPKIDTQAIVDVINFILDKNASFRVYDISLGN
jgi:NAD(P)-dependent dehydrogenase (short-subunit alcohol dehydrogenase family)